MGGGAGDKEVALTHGLGNEAVVGLDPCRVVRPDADRELLPKAWVRSVFRLVRQRSLDVLAALCFRAHRIMRVTMLVIGMGQLVRGGRLSNLDAEPSKRVDR